MRNRHDGSVEAVVAGERAADRGADQCLPTRAAGLACRENRHRRREMPGELRASQSGREILGAADRLGFLRRREFFLRFPEPKAGQEPERGEQDRNDRDG